MGERWGSVVGVGERWGRVWLVEMEWVRDGEMCGCEMGSVCGWWRSVGERLWMMTGWDIGEK